MKILIIKLGALGDVVRTTPLLRVLKGEITWITQKSALPLLEGNPYIQRIIESEESSQIIGERFQLVLNLEESLSACELVNQIDAKEMVGPYLSNDAIQYTDSSREWFDMSLISSLGKKKANQKKWENRRTYQEIFFKMIGKEFKGEEYILPEQGKKGTVPLGTVPFFPTLGLEPRSGDRWTEKRWIHFPKFKEILLKEKIPLIEFEQYPSLKQFIQKISTTSTVITTDSLALHLALGLQKKVVALFTCTSPHELYGYNRTTKVISPLLEKYFYSTDKTLKSGEAISPQTVFEAL